MSFVELSGLQFFITWGPNAILSNMKVRGRAVDLDLDPEGKNMRKILKKCKEIGDYWK